ncbi:DUF499 domain-containing protein [Coprothermobacter platensis]|uniref:DUF499 domain-containing protein n=1 Tax=Coprothermobacter platensis TaxID=108819 RepID=UPI000365B8C3|nr:DUF499 domain-containing protein [Coprothermobacter platensis]
MKTLYDLCVPRQETLAGNDADDVQELDQLLNGQIDPQNFFDKTYVTSSMKQVFEKTFSRFSDKKVGSGLIVLKQAMGGGKTHTMIATGLLCKYPHVRKHVLDANFPYPYDGEVRVLGFTGRWTDTLPWLEIAKQLGREDLLRREVLMGAAAPSDREWKNLLKGGPTLILMDEIPFYFDYALSIPAGEQTLADLIKTGLANLFNAMNSDELSQVMVLLADLEAAYEKGGEYVTNVVAGALSKEANRTGEPITPVDTSGPDIHEILRRKLFKEYPQVSGDNQDNPDVKEIVADYKRFVGEVEKSGLISTGFGDATIAYFSKTYPFHPGIIDLAKNFQNNLNFQQTRGLLRLMRRFVKYLYANDGELAKKKYFIGVTDYSLDDEDTRTLITSINPSLNNALQQDVHAVSGRAAAQLVDKSHNTDLASKFARAVLFASLSTTDPNAVGVFDEEIFLYALQRGDSIADARPILDEYWNQTRFGIENDKGKKYFSYRENVVALFNATFNTITLDEAESTATNLLKNFFDPGNTDCVYQYVEAMPNDLKTMESSVRSRRDYITLIISKPVSPRGELNEELKEWWLSTLEWKNRVLFLTGSERYYDTLIEKTKNYIAWEKVIRNLRDSGIRETDPEFERATKSRNQAALDTIQYMKNTFNKIYYPSYDISTRAASLDELEIDYSSIGGVRGPMQSSFLPEGQLRGAGDQRADDLWQILQGNNRDGAVVITKSLEGKKYFKFSADKSEDMENFLNRFRTVILGDQSIRKEITTNEIKERMARLPRWIWHDMNVLDGFIHWMVQQGMWKIDGNTIILSPEKIPEILSYDIAEYDFENETVTIRLYTRDADAIYWTFGNRLENISDANRETNLTELTINPENNTQITIIPAFGETLGDPTTINIPIKVKQTEKTIDENGNIHVQLKVLPKVDKLVYEYGSSTETFTASEATSAVELVVPTEASQVQVKAPQGEEYLPLTTVAVDKHVDQAKPLLFSPKSDKYITAPSLRDLRTLVDTLARYNASIAEAYITADTPSQNATIYLRTKEGIYQKPDQLFDIVEKMSDLLKTDENDSVNISAQIRTIYFEHGRDFSSWVNGQSNFKFENLDSTEWEQD